MQMSTLTAECAEVIRHSASAPRRMIRSQRKLIFFFSLANGKDLTVVLELIRKRVKNSISVAKLSQCAF